MDNYKIMIVEDEFVAAASIKSALIKQGFEVGPIVARGEEVFEQTQKQQPDLVLMDVDLAGEMNGIEAAQLLQSNTDVSIIFLTAFNAPNLVEQAKMAGPHGYLVKPVKTNELVIAIQMALNRRDLVREISQNEKRYRTVVENQTELICRLDAQLNLTFTNQVFDQYFKDSLSAHNHNSPLQLLPDEERAKMKIALESLNAENSHNQLELYIKLHNKSYAWIRWNLKALLAADQSLIEYQLVGRDITAVKQAQDELAEHRNQLELIVEERTQELRITNLELQQEIEQRRQIQIELEQKEIEISKQADKLREANISLRYLLQQGEEEKLELGDKISSNLKDLVFPYLEQLSFDEQNPGKKEKLELVLKNLKDIMSPFSQHLTSKLIGLSSAELKVANLVKSGKSNKEIAEICHVSTKTVEFHREGIRKKLGLKNSKINLQTYLRNME